MRTTIAVAALVAVATASVVRQDRQQVPALGNGPTIPDADRKCTKSGEKCAGVPNQPAVVYSVCCDGRLTCGVPTEAPDGEWGQFCISADNVDEDATVIANAGTLPADVPATDPTTAPPAVTTTAAEDDADIIEEDNEDVIATATEEESESGAIAKTDDDVPLETDEETGEIIDPEASDDDDDGSVCFPADATVELEDGSVVAMDSISIGDMVKVGVNEYSRVFMFTHKLAGTTNKFVTLETKSGATLTLTNGHYLLVNGDVAAASTVDVGDVLSLGNGETSIVASIGSKIGSGLFNPQTVNGNIVVNGVVSTTYTTAVEPTFAHAILAPFRLLNNFGFSFTGLESGGGVLADVAPRGQATF